MALWMVKKNVFPQRRATYHEAVQTWWPSLIKCKGKWTTGEIKDWKSVAAKYSFLIPEQHGWLAKALCLFLGQYPNNPGATTQHRGT